VATARGVHTPFVRVRQVLEEEAAEPAANRLVVKHAPAHRRAAC